MSDFLKIAEDEAKHFSLLEERLGEMGCKYGDLAVHGALWESAMETSHSLFSRLAIIHLVRLLLFVLLCLSLFDFADAIFLPA